MVSEGANSKAKRFDQTPVALVIMTGVVLGAACAIFFDFALSKVALALSNGVPHIDGLIKAIAQVLRACLAAIGLFWIRAYADDIYNKPAPPQKNVTIKKDAIALLLWTFFAALSVMMSAKIAVKGVERIFEHIELHERELYVINDSDAGRLPPSLSFTKVSWHFFFEEGNLCERPACEVDKPVHASAAQACHPDNMAVHGKNGLSEQKEIDDRDRLLGTSFHDIGNDEVVKRLIGVIDVAAQCAELEKNTEIAKDMLVLIARTSTKDWDKCTNGDKLDEALRKARAARTKELFENARRQAAAAAEDGLKPYIEALSLNDPSKNDLIDFSDDRYAAAYGSTDYSLQRDTPFNITQSVAIVLRNPAGCRLIDERSGDQTAALAE